MSVHNNPFTPGFGTYPPVLAGRDTIRNSIRVAFETGPTHPQFTSLLIGDRRSGKTVTLDAIKQIARGQGWRTFTEDASRDGLVERLTRSAVDLYAALDDNKIWNEGQATVSTGMPGKRLGRSPQPDRPFGLRSSLTALGERLARDRSGLLITVDDLHNARLDEMREIGAAIQHVTRRESRPVAFIGAALPDIEKTLMADKKATFLQRLARFPLEPLNIEAATRALAGGFEQMGTVVTPEVLQTGVNASGGHPHMVQLIGWHCWNACNDPTIQVTIKDMKEGIAEAERQLVDLVLKPLWRDISDVDRQFLLAMAEDEDESRISDIAKRLDKDVGYASVYRQRLIRQGLIAPAGRGRVVFVHPMARSWLRAEEPMNGQRLFWSPPVGEVYQRLRTQVAELRDQMGGLPHPYEAQHIWRALWYEEVHHSTAIEGNTLLLKEVKHLLGEGRAVGQKLLSEYLEVKGYADAAEWVYNQAISPNGLSQHGAILTVQEVREVHHTVMTPVWEVAPHRDATADEKPGNYRRHEIQLFPDGMKPVSWPRVPGEMTAWVDQVNSLDESLPTFPESLAEIHCRFEQIHPFLDGNGRTGRLVMNLILVRFGYPPVVIYKRHRDKYLAALQQADDGKFGPLAVMLARSILDNLHRFVQPAVTGPTEVVPLEVLSASDLKVTALRAAANRGRLQAIRGADGKWRSSQLWVDEYRESRYKRGS